MATKPGWSNVILIVSVQFVLLLIAVLVLFYWILGHSGESLARQACQNNAAIGENLAMSLSQVSDSDPCSGQSMQNVLSVAKVPNQGFLCLLNGNTGHVSFSSDKSLKLTNSNLGSIPLKPLDGSSSAPVLDWTTSAIQSATGELQLHRQSYFVSVNAVSDESVLVVAQPKNVVLASAAKEISWMRRICYVFALLMGFGGLGLALSTLNQLSEEVETENSKLAMAVTDREQALVETQNAVIYGLAKLAESRDNDTGEHLDRIRSYVMILAEDLAERMDEIDDEYVHTLALASSLHDIGKVGIPDAILLKPGRLTTEERAIMELHTLIGGDCLEAIQDRLQDNILMHFAKQIAFYHHERWDGQGYPHGLEGESIPLRGSNCCRCGCLRCPHVETTLQNAARSSRKQSHHPVRFWLSVRS